MAVSYKCTSVGCYSYQSAETNQLFQRLQMVINQLLPSIDPSTSQIKVDGILGKGTTQAALVLLDFIGAVNSGAAAAAAPGARDAYAAINGPGDLANQAQYVVDILSLYIRAQGAQPAAPPAVTAPAPTTVALATTTANAPIKTSTAQSQNVINNVKAQKSGLSTNLLDAFPPWLAYASGGLLAVGTLAAILVGANKRRKAKSASAVSSWL